MAHEQYMHWQEEYYRVKYYRASMFIHHDCIVNTSSVLLLVIKLFLNDCHTIIELLEVLSVVTRDHLHQKNPNKCCCLEHYFIIK